jgi:hypothetical protein
MARFDILGLQYFTDGGELLGGGKLNFYETGTTTRKNTFSDSAMTIANTNPVTLDADGRAPNIFFSGLAKCVLTDSTGVVLETKDPVGDDSASKNGFPDWAADVTYAFNQPVTAGDGYIYTSLVNNNIGNDPISSPTDWQLLAKTIGIPDSPNGNVLVIDTSEDLGIGSVTPTSLNTLVPISKVTASAAATVDFTGLTATYDSYVVEILKCRPETDGVNFLIRTSADNGGAYDSGGSDYSYGVGFHATGGTTSASGSTGAAEITASGGAVGNVANQECINMTVKILRPSQAAFGTLYWDGASNNQVTGQYTLFQGVGQRRAEAAFNAIRFYFSSGNVAEGIFTLYGVRTS